MTPGARWWLVRRIWPFGELVPGYRDLTLISHGGMGEVFSAKDRLGNLVAIKLLRKDMRRRAELVERFKREVEMMLRIRLIDDSNCFVEVLGHGIARDGRPFVVMELLRGKSLKAVLDEHPNGLPVSMAVDFAVDVCVGLDCAHRAKIVHRDLNLTNLFAVQTPRSAYCKILDLGIAKLHSTSDDDDITREGRAPWGATAYMPPERINGVSWDPRLDVYSLGVVLYRLLAKRAPFPGATREELEKAIMRGEFQPLDEVRPDLPPALVQTVHRAVSRLDQRHTTIRELFGELKGFASAFRDLPPPDDRTGPTLSEHGPTLGASPPRAGKRTARTAWGAAGLIVTLALTLVLAFRREQRPAPSQANAASVADEPGRRLEAPRPVPPRGSSQPSTSLRAVPDRAPPSASQAPVIATTALLASPTAASSTPPKPKHKTPQPRPPASVGPKYEGIPPPP